MNINLKIGPRFVKQDKDGMRPFQKESLEEIKNRGEGNICRYAYGFRKRIGE